MPASVNGLPVGPMTCAPALQAAGGERDVGGHRDVALARALGDPVVGGVGSVGDDDAAHERTFGQPHP